MDAINVSEPMTLDGKGRILAELESLEQQPEQVNVGDFDFSTCQSVYLDEMVAKSEFEFPELDTSFIDNILSDSSIHQPNTNLNRVGSNCARISPNRQEFGYQVEQYLAVTSEELRTLKIQVKQLQEMFLKLHEHIHKPTATNQVNPPTLLNQQTQVEIEPTPTVDEGARLGIDLINNVTTMEELLLSDSSPTQEVREIESVSRNVKPLTEECNEERDDVAPDGEQQHEEVLSSRYPLPAALHQNVCFTLSQKVRSPLVEENVLAIENVPRSVQLLSYGCNERNVIIDVEQQHETQVISPPHLTLLRQQDSMQTKQVRPGRIRKDGGNSHNRESKTHFCKVCNKGFNSKSHLIEHVTIHTGEKPFKCGECDVAFIKKPHLTAHRRIHTGEKPFKCGDCDVAFSQLANFTKHQRIHTGEKPFKCGDCDISFSQKVHLTAHQRIHTGEKPFKCSVCDAAFRRKENLTSHHRTHTGEKPFKCSECDVAFGRKSYLTAHQRIHTGAKPHKCNVCKIEFRHRSTLTQHKKIHANETFKKNTNFRLEEL